jgi:hypothetical protein
VTEKFFFASDNPGHETWQLVPSVHQQAADDFSVNLMRVHPKVGPSPFIDDLEQELAPYRLPDGEREHLEFSDTVQLTRRCLLWRLTVESIAILERYLPDGLVAEPTYSTDGWLENPRFYRNGEVALGAITHEFGGFVRVGAVISDGRVHQVHETRPQTCAFQGGKETERAYVSQEDRVASAQQRDSSGRGR